MAEPWRSREWYSAAFGFVPILDLERESGVIGVVVRHPSGLVVGLHADRDRAAALRGFAVLSLAVADPLQLEAWAVALDRDGIARGRIRVGHLGPYLEVPDPDGVLVRLHSGRAPYSEEA